MPDQQRQHDQPSPMTQEDVDRIQRQAIDEYQQAMRIVKARTRQRPSTGGR